MKNYESVQLTIPNDFEYFNLAQVFVREVAKEIGFTGNSLNQIDIAIEESVTNVMKHTYDREENKTFDIICTQLPDGIQITLKEMGIPFDPNRTAKFDISKGLADLSTEGFGTFIIQKVMDDYSFHNLGHMGKETRMVKYLPGRHGMAAGGGAADSPVEDPKILTEKIEYSVRGLQPEEAIEVSRCAYKSHGYSFFDEHIYYPERLVEMNRTHEMLSAVAVTKDNVFMGHCAFLYQYPEDRIAELTFAFVNIEYRGQGALNRLVEYLLNVPKPRELTGIYAYAVANHPFTQKSMIKYQIRDCGILLATSPASWKFKGISDDTTQRISVVLGFRYMGPPSPPKIYPPLHHRDMIIKLYRNIGSAPELVEVPEKDTDFSQKESVLVTSVNELENCGEMWVDEYGEDVLLQVRKALRSLCLKQTAAINLFLKLTDPLTAIFAAKIEEMGFFFAGVLPDSRIGDALILQYLNNVNLDYGKIVLYDDFTKEILKYIRERDPNDKIQNPI